MRATRTYGACLGPVTLVPSARRGAALAALAALCWGAAMVMSKAALDAFAPVPLLVIQLAASVGLLLNILDSRYNSFGVYGDPTGNGAFPAFSDPRLYTPGAPFGFWLGVELDF